MKSGYGPDRIPAATFWGAILLVAFGFGTGYPTTRLAILEGVPVPVVVLARNGGALILLTLYLALTRRLSIPKGAWRKGLVLGLFYQALPSLLFAAGLVHLSAGYGSVVIGLIPLATAAIAHVLVGTDRLSVTKAAGLGLGFAGVAVLFLAGNGSIGSQRLLLGTMLLLLGVISAGFGYVYARLHAPMVSIGHLLLPQFLTATILTLSVLILSPNATSWSALATAWFPVAWLSVVSTFVTFVTLIWLSGRVPATRTVLVEYLAPPIGVIGGVVVLGESLSWSLILGGLLILAGLVLANQVSRAESQYEGTAI